LFPYFINPLKYLQTLIKIVLVEWEPYEPFIIDVTHMFVVTSFPLPPPILLCTNIPHTNKFLCSLWKKIDFPRQHVTFFYPSKNNTIWLCQPTILPLTNQYVEKATFFSEIEFYLFCPIHFWFTTYETNSIENGMINWNLWCKNAITFKNRTNLPCFCSDREKQM
jgi:hypothetical protein